MKSLMTFMGIAAFNFVSLAHASDFSCPLTGNIATFTCSGTVKVETLDQLNAYKNSLGVVAKKPTVAKNLLINFNPALTADLAISTPCTIKIAKDVVMTSTANICLHGAKGITIDENFNFNGNNLLLESKEEVVIKNFSTIKALDIKLLSIGSGDTSKAAIREGANIEAANLSIESFDKGFVGKKSVVKLTGALGIYTLGDDEASVREGARVEAAKIEISSTEETRVAKSTTLVANEIILNGAKCTINKTAVITAVDRIGNCFLGSTNNKAKFSIDKNQGGLPLTVNFNASTIVNAKGFIWSFGDGETLNSLTPNVTHVYNRVGSFTATLKYATKENYKGLKSAGSIQIDVKDVPVVVPVPPKGYLKYQIDNTFVYLSAFITKTTYDIANAYYIIDDNPANKIQIPNFYQNAISGVELNTYGRHKATMHVVDVQGQTYSKSMNIYVEDSKEYIYPYVRLDYDQSAPRTMFFDMSKSFNPSKGKTLRDFKIDFGDGQTAVVTDATTITHTYAQAGTYHVKVTAEANGNEDFDEADIEVTNDDSPIMNPLAGFEYNIYDYAGNVVFADERSGTPNGEIISYAWDFGDGTVGYGKNATNFYAPGDYLVTLTVTDTAGMRASQTQKISILDPGVDIAAILDCEETDTKKLECRIIAVDKFNQIARVKLDWGDGQIENLTVADMPERGQSIRVHEYANFGTYDVKLTVDTSRGQTVYANQEKTLSEFSDRVTALLECFTYGLKVNCVGTGSSSLDGHIVNYKFDFGNGNIYENSTGEWIHYYAASGTYQVTLNVEDSSGKMATHTVPVTVVSLGPPVANIQCSADKLLVTCNAFGSYDLQGSPLTYEFTFGVNHSVINTTGIASYQYENSGTQNIVLTIRNLQGEESKAYLLIDTNDGSLVAKMFCNNLYLQVHCFANQSVSLNSEIVNYRFEFSSDSKIDTTANSLGHTYSAAGTYRITLIVKNAEGLTASTFTDISVSPSTPEAHLGCVTNYLLVSCNGLNTFDYSGKALKYEFQMGDGTTILSESGIISHSYTASGLYTVKLKVTNEFENSGLTEQVVQVLSAPENQYPVIGINCISDRPNSLFCSLGGSTDADGWIQSYSIEFENNEEVSWQSDFGHTYLSGGSKEIKVKLVDDKGAVTTGTYFFIVVENIIPQISLTCENNLTYEVSCEAEVSAGESNDYITEYSWEMGDGVSYQIFNSYSKIKHKYLKPGTYTVKTTVKDTYNGVASSTNVMVVKENIAPEAHANCIKITDKEYNCIAEGSKDLDGFITNYEWIIDGRIINSDRFLHIFQDGGSKTVKLKVTDNHGEINTDELIIDVNLPPADFNCIPLSDYKFKCEGIAHKAGSNKALIDFKYLIDDSFEYDERVMTHEFTSPGEHQIAYFTRDSSGATTLQYKYVAIIPSYLLPEAHFEEVIDNNKLFYFDATDSLSKGRNVVLYKWNFAGTAIEATSAKISHRFESFGEKLVSLSVVDEKGEIHTFSKYVTVYDPEVPYPVNNDFTISGVDSDNNGIRDDVQRWIVFAGLSNSMLKDQLSKLSRNWQEALTLDINDEEQINLAKERENVNYCLQSFLNSSENVKSVVGDHAAMMFDTRTRLKKLSEINAKVNGTLLIGVETDNNLSQFCN